MLPRLGGAPTVWSVAIVFFQAALLTGYVAQGFDVPPTEAITFWLIGLLACSIGLPFTVLAASAPLLQGWFASSGHVQARNPYVLYAASASGEGSEKWRLKVTRKILRQYAARCAPHIVR